MALTHSSTRLVCVSDTHSSYGFTLPPGDILIHAGDFTETGRYEEMVQYLSWLRTLTEFRLKVIIAGNHDVTLDRPFYDNTPRRFHTIKEDTGAIQKIFHDPELRTTHGIIYLQDDTFVDPVTQLKFYGSPWQPAFCSWAFNLKRDGDEIRAVWEKIPADTDILITHGPPYGILDSTDFAEHVGCRALLSRVQAIRPKLHVFGHIHEAHGKEQPVKQSTIFVNASICDGRGKAVQPAIVVEL